MPIRALDCWYLTGPTASGKTKVGLELAHLLGAEIISLDSMALYRGMDIGTAKPTPAEQAAVPHHLIDLIDPDQDYSLAAYLDAAHAKIAEIRSRGKEVLFVGGTPLYLKGLLRGVFEGPPADWEFRRAVEAETKEIGTEALHARLGLVDPLTAAKLHHNDMRRIIRALEVYHATGVPISHLQAEFEEGTAPEECKVFVLDWPRATLHARINARVDGMFSMGLVDEVRHLAAKFDLSRTARQAVGYGEVLSHLAGDAELADTITNTKTRTRQFAKRQMTWFRGLCEARLVPQFPDVPPEEIAQQILELGQSQ